MNCRPGDLAIVILRPYSPRDNPNIGKMVTCIRIEAPPLFFGAQLDPTLGPVWLVDRPLRWYIWERHEATGRMGGMRNIDMPYMDDASLRPIRPQPDGEFLVDTPVHEEIGS